MPHAATASAQPRPLGCICRGIGVGKRENELSAGPVPSERDQLEGILRDLVTLAALQRALVGEDLDQNRLVIRGSIDLHAGTTLQPQPSRGEGLP